MLCNMFDKLDLSIKNGTKEFKASKDYDLSDKLPMKLGRTKHLAPSCKHCGM